MNTFIDDDLGTQTRWEIWEEQDERRQRTNRKRGRQRPPDPMMGTFLREIAPNAHELGEDDHAVAQVIALHCAHRFRQRDHEPLEEIGGRRDCVFLTVAWVRLLLRRLGYRKNGRDFARWVIGRAQELGYIEDTGQTRKPRRSPQSLARAEKFQRVGHVQGEGGEGAQVSTLRSCWWRIFRVVALSRLLAAYSEFPTPAFASEGQTWCGVPRSAVSLCRFFIRQGLLSPPRPRKSFRYGSVQAAFWATGPP